MKIIIYLGHPAQYHFFRNIVKQLHEQGKKVLYVVRDKDVLAKLLDEERESYINILPEGRKSTKIGMFTGLIKRDLRLYPIVKKERPDLLMGSDPSVTHIGRLLGIPALTLLEDDVHVIPSLAKLAYPFTRNIVVPEPCDCGKWNGKKISYAGYMKLSYLHPKYFSIKRDDKEKYFLIRTSKLNAHHDKGIKGLDSEIIKKVIELLTPYGNVRISSEGEISPEFKKYELKINPAEMHKILYNSEMLISDSQSMTMEAAMLGVPSIRFSDFAGRIGVLEELEKKYDLTYGIKSTQVHELYSRITDLLHLKNRWNVFQKRRKKMLSDKIDVTKFLVWLISEYPKSITILKNNPDYQYSFK